MQKSPATPGNPRGRWIRGIIVCLALLLALPAGWVAWRSIDRAEPQQEPSAVVRMKVPRPSPAVAVPQGHAIEDERMVNDGQFVGEADAEALRPVSDPPQPEVMAFTEVAVANEQHPMDEIDTAQIEPAAGPSDVSPAFSIQTGAFLSRDNALRAQQGLAQKEHAAFIHEYQDARERRWYTVRIGRFATLNEANLALDQFNRAEGAAAFLVRRHD